MENNHKHCLVLNADYSPLGIVHWKKAVVWSFKYESQDTYGIEIIDFYSDDYIRCVNNKRMAIPSIIKTTKYFKIFNQPVNFSRKNLFIRDNYTCQYCGEQKNICDLTYDHVIPKSILKYKDNISPTTWTNIVTACRICNTKKGNRTPQQAKMPLKNQPYIPNKSAKYLPVTDLLIKIDKEIPREWFVYLSESYTR